MEYTDYRNVDDDFVENVKNRLRADLEVPQMPKLVQLYFDPGQPFAGHEFDHLGVNDPYRIATDDLLAVSMLDVAFRPLEVRALLQGRSETISGHLAEIVAKTDLWDATEQEMWAVDPLWDALIDIPGIGETRASKLLARKRPRLAVITDSVTVAAIGARGQTWPVLRRCLQDESFRNAILRLRGRESGDVSVLRLLDVALWMLHSRSEVAREARRSAGLPPSRP